MPASPSGGVLLAEESMKTRVRPAQSLFAVSVAVGAGGRTFWETWFLPCGADRHGVRLQGRGKEAVSLPVREG